MASESGKLDRDDLIKIGKGAAIAAAGAVAAYLASLAADWKDDPGYVAIAGAVASVLANLLRKWVANNTPTAAVLLLALFWSGSADAIEFVGPAKAETGQQVQLELSGLPAIDLEKPFGENLRWSTTLKIASSQPEGDAGKLRQSLSIDFASSKWVMVVSFAPAKNGTYVVAATLNGELVQHRVEVGKAPQPPPDPMDPETPPGKVERVTVVYEKSQSPVPMAVQAALSRLNQTKGIPASEFERDSRTADGSVPKQYQAAEAAAKGKQLPCAVVQYADGKIVTIERPSAADIERLAP